MRLPYVDDDPQMTNAEDQAIVARVKARRGGQLIPLDKALLHAPPVADGWNSFLGAIRTKTTLSDSIRELAICRVAVLNQAWFEWEHHKPLLEQGGKLDGALIEKLKDREWDGHGLPDEQHAAVFHYTNAMTLGCIVRDPVFAKLRELFNDREVVEITATVAAYNTVSRFLVALNVGEMAEKHGIDMS